VADADEFCKCNERQMIRVTASGTRRRSGKTRCDGRSCSYISTSHRGI